MLEDAADCSGVAPWATAVVIDNEIGIQEAWMAPTVEDATVLEPLVTGIADRLRVRGSRLLWVPVVDHAAHELPVLLACGLRFHHVARSEGPDVAGCRRLDVLWLELAL